MNTVFRAAILAASASAAAAAIAAGPPPLFRTQPTPGVRHYLYEVVQTINGTTRRGWRTEFDLEASDGALHAVVRKAEELGDKGWKPIAAVDEACRAAMHGDHSSLARVQLFPVSAETAKDLGPSFLAACAPPGILFPLTDILNVAIIPLSGQFRVSELAAIGQSVRYRGFDAAYDRAGEKIKETSRGGEVRLAALDSRRAVIDWRPDLADLDLTERSSNPPTAMKGNEHWAFRLELDRDTGVIERASTIYDDLNLTIVGAPASMAHVRIARSVLIERQ